MSKEEINEAIGGRIRMYRESLGMNREAFSEMIGLSPQFLAEAENGKKGLSATSIYKICSSSGMSADYLVLGRIKKDKLKTPLDNALLEMPEEYSEHLVKVVQAFSDMATSVRKDGRESKKKMNE